MFGNYMSYPQYYPQQPAAQPAQQSGITWVQGEEGAKAYVVGPGSSALLMDSEGSTFYIKTTDQAGMPLPLRVFDFTERQKQPVQAPAAAGVQFATRDELNALAAKIEALTAKRGRKAAQEEPENE